MLAFKEFYFIVTRPGYFTVLFSLGLMCVLYGRAQWSGPRAYINKICNEKYRFRTCLLILSIIGALVCAFVIYNYILALACCACEFAAVLTFFCNANLCVGDDDEEESDAKPLIKNKNPDTEKADERKTNETELK